MPVSRIILVLYAFTATTNVIASGSGHSSLFWATKPLLMPLLAAFVIFALRSPAWLLVIGLSFATVGDVALMIDGTVPFYVGMAAFAGCHFSYIAAFTRASTWHRLRRPPLVVVPLIYGIVVVAAEIVLRLPVPVLVYGCVLAVMATSAAGLGWRTGTGAALFLVSDLLIGIGLAGTELPGPPIWVMLTYVAGQLLIMYGWVRRHEVGELTIPRQRTHEADDRAVPAPAFGVPGALGEPGQMEGTHAPSESDGAREAQSRG